VPQSQLFVCPKCGSHRTRSLGAASSIYLRCDACDFIFRPPDLQPERPPEKSLTPHRCSKCGSERTRIVGQSGTPPVVHRRCEACGDVSSSDFTYG